MPALYRSFLKRAGRVAMDSRSNHEGVAVGILEDGGRSPRLLARRLKELDPPLDQLAVGLLHVVAGERHAREAADSIFVAGRREEGEARLASGDLELDPSPAFAHRLIGDDLETELVGVEGERSILVLDRDAHELDALEHG